MDCTPSGPRSSRKTLGTRPAVDPEVRIKGTNLPVPSTPLDLALTFSLLTGGYRDGECYHVCFPGSFQLDPEDFLFPLPWNRSCPRKSRDYSMKWTPGRYLVC